MSICAFFAEEEVLSQSLGYCRNVLGKRTLKGDMYVCVEKMEVWCSQKPPVMSGFGVGLDSSGRCCELQDIIFEFVAGGIRRLQEGNRG
jgi:hypothetical protein